MNKTEALARLKELAVILGREVDTTGTAADIEQRVIEWEEEAVALQEESEPQINTEGNADPVAAIAQPGGLVLVKFLKTVHMPGVKDEDNQEVEFPCAGSTGFVSAADAELLKGAGLITIG
ncbi:DNA-packaging protein FI [Klebsiella pneumoniae]|uniref:DNA-packaging protein FI n=1 Tax=Klebsiella pneumoniae TaxID=573 RepID=UPI00190E8BDE|nr:DNA-packaging protein FI [Klebsiella pneumoniae]